MAAARDEAEARALRPLFEWAATAGVPPEQLANLRVGFDESGMRGLFATRDLEPGTVVVEMPPGALLGEEHVRASPLAPLLDEFCERESSFGREPCAGSPALAAFLLLERARRAGSPWRAYVDCLPPAFDLPLFWSEADVARLRGTATAREVRRVREWADGLQGPLAARAAQLCPEQLAAVSPADVRWALAAVWSRCFTFPAPAPRHVSQKLAPLFDLMNHSPTQETNTRRTKTAGGLRLEAARRIAAGEQVFVCYGSHPSTTLLANWGFVPAGRGDDELALGPLDPPEADPPALRAAKQRALAALGPAPLRAYPTGLGSRLAAAAAVAAAESEGEVAALSAAPPAALPPRAARYLAPLLVRQLAELKAHAAAGRGPGPRAAAARAAREGEARLLAGRLRALLARIEGGEAGGGEAPVPDADPPPAWQA